jgi:hypothetical protein
LLEAKTVGSFKGGEELALRSYSGIANPLEASRMERSCSVAGKPRADNGDVMIPPE